MLNPLSYACTAQLAQACSHYVHTAISLVWSLQRTQPDPDGRENGSKNVCIVPGDTSLFQSWRCQGGARKRRSLLKRVFDEARWRGRSVRACSERTAGDAWTNLRSSSRPNQTWNLKSINNRNVESFKEMRRERKERVREREDTELGREVKKEG